MSNAEQIAKMLDALYKVYGLPSCFSSLGSSLDNASKTIQSNCRINDEGPKVNDLSNMKGYCNSSVSTIYNHVIPNLIYHIQMLREEDEYEDG